MPPEPVIKKAVGCLMTAYKGCSLFHPGIGQATHILYPSNSAEQYWLTPEAESALADVIRRSTQYLDHYPETAFRQVLQTIVADARQTHPTVCAAVSRDIEAGLRSFFARLGKQGDWETLFAVSGIAGNENPFTLGAVRFFKMDRTTYQTWRVPTSPAAQLTDNLVGGWAATLCLPAIDGGHAVAKALPRVEAAINVLRYGSFRWGNPWRCVRLGAERAAYWSGQSLARPVAFPKAVSQFLTDGSEGLHLQVCQLTRGYEAVAKVLAKDPPKQSELERLVLDGITWVGQAAAAALNPVRLVLLVTALEVLLIDDHESLGKRSKIAKRLAAIIPRVIPDEAHAAAVGDRLYHLRSECLHTGATGVAEDDVEIAFDYTAAVVSAFLTLPPFTTCATLQSVLAIIDPPSTATPASAVRLPEQPL